MRLGGGTWRGFDKVVGFCVNLWFYLGVQSDRVKFNRYVGHGQYPIEFDLGKYDLTYI